MIIKGLLPILLLVSITPLAFCADQATVRVEPSNLSGPRTLEKQTSTAIIRDYLQSWQSMRAALNQNRVDLLDADFVGTAKKKLTETLDEQTKMGIHTSYQDRSHDLQIIFYSPDGLSVQLVDNVEYEQRVFDHDRLLTVQLIHARYIVVLTPAEMRWRVRIFQAETQ
jgi:hypothetical protein